MNKAVKLYPLSGEELRSRRCEDSLQALKLARLWSLKEGLSYAMTGLELTVFRDGVPANETSSLKLARDSGVDL